MSSPGRRAALARLPVPAMLMLAIATRVVVVGVLLDRISGDRAPEGYIERFGQIATAPGRPYADHPVEYPPVTLAAIEVLGDEDPRATGTRVLWLMLGADALVAASLLWGWGSRAALAYLVGSLPVLAAAYQTLDLLPVALAAAGVALAWRRRERSGGAVLAAAVLAKVWPVVLLPGLPLWGRRRALAWAVGALAVGLGLWVAWAGPDALSQVATQRRSPGWEAESTVGVLVWILGDEPVRIVQDSPRLGTAPGWAEALLALASVVGIGLVWLRAYRRGGSGEVGAPALAAVAVLLFFASIYSYPYVLWLLPWGAIAFAEGRRVPAVIGFGVVAITTVLYAMLTGGVMASHPGAAQALIVVRDLATGAIPLAYALGRDRGAYTANPPRSATNA